MLGIYRRHQKRCAHRHEGRKYRRCQCPVWVDGHLNGVEIHQSLHTRDWQKAQRIVREWEADDKQKLEASTPEMKPQPVTVEQAWNDYIADLEACNLKKSTLRKYRLLRRQMQEFTSTRAILLVKDINSNLLRQFRFEWKDGPLSSTKKLERLRAFFRFVQENKWIDDNPAAKLKAPKSAQRPTLPFTQAEMIRILAALPEYLEGTSSRGKESARRLRTLVLLLRYSGMRIGDVVRLTRDKFNGNKLFLYTQKSGVPVYAVLPDIVIAAIESTPLLTVTHFFWNGADQLDCVVGSWQRRPRKLFRLAKISEGHAHRFRDTFATELLLVGVPMDRVATLLGHQSVKVTEKFYAAWTAERQRQAEADLERAWGRDPIVLQEGKNRQKLDAKTEFVN
jgi:integrase/recombinase XerD